MERFSMEQLIDLHRNVHTYAIPINGLPLSHSEVFEKRGWLLPYLFSYDDLLWGRWTYWSDILLKGTLIGSGPIPQIQWSDMGSTGVENTKKMFAKCLHHNEATIENFADWLLWGLACSDDVPVVSERLNEHYYRTFDIFPVLDNPYDYLSHLLCEQSGKGYKAALGYYPTPFHVTRMMVDFVHSNEEPEKMKRQTVNDPCVGCGAMLLPASNYYLRGTGQDISSIAVRLCKIQMNFYAPWYAKPGNIEGFEEETKPIELIINPADSRGEEGQFSFAF
jgi:hypothetical protein